MISWFCGLMKPHCAHWNSVWNQSSKPFSKWIAPTNGVAPMLTVILFLFPVFLSYHHVIKKQDLTDWTALTVIPGLLSFTLHTIHSYFCPAWDQLRKKAIFGWIREPSSNPRLSSRELLTIAGVSSWLEDDREKTIRWCRNWSYRRMRSWTSRPDRNSIVKKGQVIEVLTVTSLWAMLEPWEAVREAKR